MNNAKTIKTAAKAIFKNVAKQFGYKTISGIPYKIVHGELYKISVLTSTARDEVEYSISLHFKPLCCDDMLWKILEISDDMCAQSASIHCIGAFTAPCVRLTEKTCSIKNEDEIADFFQQFETFEHLINDSDRCWLNSLYISDTTTDYGITQNILYYIAKGNHRQALFFIEKELEQGKDGLFVLGDRAFMKSAKEYCLKGNC